MKMNVRIETDPAGFDDHKARFGLQRVFCSDPQRFEVHRSLL